MRSADHIGRGWKVWWLFHLIVPALLFIDILTALMRGKIVFGMATPGTAVMVASALWLVAGAAIFIVLRDRTAGARRIYAPLLVIYTAYIAVFLVEGAVRIAGVTVPIPGIHQPGTRAVINYPPDAGPGMGGLKHFTINQLGLRGPMPPANRNTYRIVAIGGSTTICAELDDSEEWPHLLMQDLNAPKPLVPVWVGNAGVSGRNAVNHIVMMQWLPGLLNFDMVVFLVGVNDLQATLAREGGPTDRELENEAGFEGNLPEGARWRSKPAVYPYYRRLHLFLAIDMAKRNLSAILSPKRSLPLLNLGEQRKRRASSPVRPLPDLSVGLREYRNRLVVLANLCRAAGKRCLFLTQPTLWRHDLSAYEGSLLWLGYVGQWEKPNGYVSAGDMARAMDLYNRTLLAVCNQQKMECLDLASLVPKDISAFHDEMHFNPSGSRQVARILAGYLTERPPFSIDK